MLHAFLSRLAGTALIAPALAFGAAHSSVHVSGDADVDVSVAVSTNTAAFYYTFFTVDLDPGQTVSRSFTYTVSLADDGLSAVRPPDDPCTPDFLTDCGPPATGFEQAYALIEVGRDRRNVDENDFWVVDSSFQQSFHSVTGNPRQFTGTITYTATDSSEFLAQSVQLQVMLYALADVHAVVAVDEAASWSLLALGLLPLLARRRAGGAVSRSGPAT
jgi:hypothetical protein